MAGSTGSQQALISQCYSRWICHRKKEGLFTAQRKRAGFVEIEREDPHFSSVTIPTVTVRYMKQAGRRKRKKRENTKKEKWGEGKNSQEFTGSSVSMCFLWTLVYAGSKTDFLTIRSVSYATSFSVFYQSNAIIVSCWQELHVANTAIVHRHWPTGWNDEYLNLLDLFHVPVW